MPNNDLDWDLLHVTGSERDMALHFRFVSPWMEDYYTQADYYLLSRLVPVLNYKGFNPFTEMI